MADRCLLLPIARFAPIAAGCAPVRRVGHYCPACLSPFPFAGRFAGSVCFAVFSAVPLRRDFRVSYAGVLPVRQVVLPGFCLPVSFSVASPAGLFCLMYGRPSRPAGIFRGCAFCRPSFCGLSPQGFSRLICGRPSRPAGCFVGIVSAGLFPEASPAGLFCPMYGRPSRPAGCPAGLLSAGLFPVASPAGLFCPTYGRPSRPAGVFRALCASVLPYSFRCRQSVGPPAGLVLFCRTV